jgi:hypothetical protein
MGIRRFLRKLFHCTPKYNGAPVAFYRRNGKGEWEKIADVTPLSIKFDKYEMK